MLKMRNLVLISMLLLLISACGVSEENKAPKTTQPASINTGVKRVEEHIAQQQDSIEQNVLEPEQTVNLAPVASQTSTNAASTTEVKIDTQPTPERTSIHTIVMQNKYGQVAFNHAAHTEFASCATCHPTEPPTRIDKNRKEFHDLCRTCHQESGAGPIKCSGCHAH